MTRPIVFVGEAPSRRSDPALPLRSGATGSHLRDLAGESWEEIEARSTFVNLFDRPRRGWFSLGARARAHDLMVGWTLLGPDPSLVVMMRGRRVAAAFGVDAAFLQWTSLPGYVCQVGQQRIAAVVLPHPSRRSRRWWNHADNQGAARSFLRSLSQASIVEKSVDAARETG